MQKLLVAAGVLLLGCGVMGAALQAQDTPTKKDTEASKIAKAENIAVYKATISGMV